MVEQAAAAVEVEPGGLVLLALPADADAEVEPPAGQHVERRRRLGQHDRAAQRGDQDVGAEADALGRAGDDATAWSAARASGRRVRSAARRPAPSPRARARPYASRCSPNTTWSDTTSRSTPQASRRRARSSSGCQPPRILGGEVGAVDIESWGWSGEGTLGLVSGSGGAGGPRTSRPGRSRVAMRQAAVVRRAGTRPGSGCRGRGRSGSLVVDEQVVGLAVDLARRGAGALVDDVAGLADEVEGLVVAGDELAIPPMATRPLPPALGVRGSTGPPPAPRAWRRRGRPVRRGRRHGGPHRRRRSRPGRGGPRWWRSRSSGATLRADGGRVRRPPSSSRVHGSSAPRGADEHEGVAQAP